VPDRIRTRDLFVLLRAHVPTSAIAKTPLAIFVLYPSPLRAGLLVAVLRTHDGWEAALVSPDGDVSNDLELRPFVTVEEAIALFDEIWPVTDDSMSDILGDRPDHPRAVAVASLAQLFLEHFAQRLRAKKGAADA